MLVKNRFQFLLALLLLAVIGGILLIVLTVSWEEQAKRDYEATVESIKQTNDLVQTVPYATQRAKPWTVTPPKGK
jgi:hypothetical protein